MVETPNRKVEIILLIIIGVLLIVTYQLNMRELIKIMLTWGFALTSYDLLFGNLRDRLSILESKMREK